MSAYGVFADWYDLLTEDVDYDARCRDLCAALSQYGVRDGLLLDLACGTGSLSVLLSAAGYDVIGVDFSPDMLSCAQQKAFEAGEQILFLCQPMQMLDLYGTIRAAVCMLDSLNHLTSFEDLCETIRRVSLFLEPGGVFIFDVNTPYKHQHILADNTFVRQCEDLFLVWQNELSDEDTVRISLDFFERTQEDVYIRSTEQFEERAYALQTFREILERAGLEIQAVYGEKMFSAPLPDAQRWTIAAIKQEG